MKRRRNWLRPLAAVFGVALILGWWFEPKGPVIGSYFDLVLGIVLVALSLPFDRSGPDEPPRN